MVGRTKEREQAFLDRLLKDRITDNKLSDILKLYDSSNPPIAFGHPHLKGEFIVYKDLIRYEVNGKRDFLDLNPIILNDNRWWYK